MSVKNLARAIIQGGRNKNSKRERRHETRRERVNVRRLVRELADQENGAVLPRRKRVYPEFADRLGPVQGWMEKTVGQNYDAARGRLTGRYDRRTTAGRHLVEDHILSQVNAATDVRASTYRYVVDEDGTLRRGTDMDLPDPVDRGRYERNSTDWAEGRFVTHVGGVPHWFVPCRWENGLDLFGKKRRIPVACDLGPALTDAETDRFDCLTGYARRKLRFDPRQAEYSRRLWAKPRLRRLLRDDPADLESESAATNVGQ